MNEIVDFLLQHWQLSAIFIALLVAYIVFEMKQEPGQRAVSVDQAVALYNHEHGVILDIRTKEAFEQGHIVGAAHLDTDNLDSKMKKLQKYQQKPIIIVCNDGKHSATLVKRMQKEGFTRVQLLAGGIKAWQTAGLPLTTASSKHEV